MLINIIGCDGCGKTTQLGMLQPWLEHVAETPVRSIKKRDLFDLHLFPETARMFGCSYRELMYEILPTMKGERRALFLFYMLAASTAHYPPRPDELVLLDGGWHKHVATEAALGVDFEWLEALARGLPRPDLTIFLDVDPVQIIAWRKANDYGPHAPYECGCTGELSDASFLRMMRQVREHLHTLAKLEGWHVLDGARPKERVLEDIKALVMPAIRGQG